MSFFPRALALSLIVVSPAFAEDYGHDDHVAALGAVTVTHAWVAAAGAGADAVVFFEIENAGPPVVLSGGEVENAAGVEIVGAAMGADGTLAYQPIGEFTIPSGAFDFDHKGLGMRLNDLTGDLTEGEHFHMHLLLGGDELEISVEVQAADAVAHSHAGHNH